MVEYTNSQMAAAIDEYIHDERHRHILKRRFIDHITYERLAEEMKLDDSTIKRIVRKNEWTVFKHL